MLDGLTKYQFNKIGQWMLSTKYTSTKHLKHLEGISFVFNSTYDKNLEKDVVYAFVVEDIVLYIGETTAGLSSRFLGYRYGNPLPRDTDNNVKKAITTHLRENKKVEIYSLKPEAVYLLPNGDKIIISASKPLEEHLIQELNPPINTKNIKNS